MKTLAEIKEQFENKSFLVRSDFINDYHFEDDYIDYYRQFLQNATSIKDPFYLSDLIDLTGWLGIYDTDIRARYYAMLFEKRHYLVKLAVLDYFKHCSREILPACYTEDLNTLYKQRQPTILKCQLSYNLISCQEEEAAAHIVSLLQLINKTADWKVIHRLLLNLDAVKLQGDTQYTICKGLLKRGKEIGVAGKTKELLASVCH